MKELYIIETRNDQPGATGQAPWASDTIGENEPRSHAECEADVAAFQSGECGPEFAAAFADASNWRIVEG